MPLEFLRRKGTGTPAGKAPAAAMPVAPQPIPEEALAEDHQLRLNFAAKTSAGVRLQGGPNALGALPHMLDGLALSPIEVVEPRETSLTIASPSIIRTEEAAEWLRAHSISPATRASVFVRAVK